VLQILQSGPSASLTSLAGLGMAQWEGPLVGSRWLSPSLDPLSRRTSQMIPWPWTMDGVRSTGCTDILQSSHPADEGCVESPLKCRSVDFCKARLVVSWTGGNQEADKRKKEEGVCKNSFVLFVSFFFCSTKAQRLDLEEGD
jgi:hypothetical protein